MMDVIVVGGGAAGLSAALVAAASGAQAAIMINRDLVHADFTPAMTNEMAAS